MPNKQWKWHVEVWGFQEFGDSNIHPKIKFEGQEVTPDLEERMVKAAEQMIRESCRAARAINGIRG